MLYPYTSIILEKLKDASISVYSARLAKCHYGRSNNVCGSMFGEYGESNILEELVSGSSDSANYQTKEFQHGSTEPDGLDILQQSLKAADIIGTSDSGELSFDDLGLTYNGSAYNSAVNSPCNFASRGSSPGSSNCLSRPQDRYDESFDTSQFFNLGKDDVGTAEIQSNNASYNKPPVPSSSAMPATSSVFAGQQTQLIHPQQSVTYSPAVTRQVTVITPRTVQQQADPAGNQSSKYGLFKIHLPASSHVLSTTQGSSYILSTHPNIQYVVSNSQTMSATCSGNSASGSILSQANLSTFGTATTVSNIAGQTVSSTPIVLRVGVPQQTVHLTNGQNQQHQPALQQIATNTTTLRMNPVQTLPATTTNAASSQIGNTFEEQTNKLVALLRTKANQLIDSGNPAIVKVGNQTVDISNPNIAKALAANILQQRMKQQSQNHAQSLQQGATATSVKTVNKQGPVAVGHAYLQPQVKAPYVVASASPAQILPTPDSLRKGIPSNVTLSQGSAPVVTRAHTPGTFVQVALPKSSNAAPINRIQIASVNIPIANLNQASAAVTKSPALSQHRSVNVDTSQLPIVTKTMNSPHGTGSLRSFAANQESPNTVSLTIQQSKTTTKDQLQRLLLQNRAGVQAKSTNLQSISSVDVGTKVVGATALPMSNHTSSVTSATLQKQVFSHAPGYATFQVEPNLTLQQVEQVQQIITHKLPAQKVPQLTKEQRQLLAAFRAQLRTMDAPVQMYYLRNPQLFLQKVYQHLQTGKTFELKIKIDKSNIVKTHQTLSTGSGSHPTISLSSSETSGNLKRPSAPVSHSLNKIAKRPTPDASSIIKPAPTLSPVVRPSLIMEQLQRHKDIVSSPSIEAPFKDVRDAFRRLLPYHVCNTPQIKENYFEECEPLYDSISSRLTSKLRKMILKYHTLVLNDSTREDCSADVVMVERMFLQHERATLLEDKKLITENPSAIRKFVAKSSDQDNASMLSFLEAEASREEPACNGVSSDRDSADQKLVSKSPDSAAVSTDSVPDVLLEEAVQSIL